MPQSPSFKYIVPCLGKGVSLARSCIVLYTMPDDFMQDTLQRALALPLVISPPKCPEIVASTVCWVVTAHDRVC